MMSRLSDFILEILVIGISLAITLFLVLAQGDWQVSSSLPGLSPYKLQNPKREGQPEQRTRPARSYKRSYQAFLSASEPQVFV